ncbi:hypothetical protein TNCV_4766421 [Trichonephila clavipes]|nr:hypothetical protein TNCV_4766421 [Trichonephila clavipes]
MKYGFSATYQFFDPNPLMRVRTLHIHWNTRSLRSRKLNRRFLLGVWTVNSPQSHIVRVYDAGHGKIGVFHSAEWHDGDWSSDGIREAWLWFFIWVARKVFEFGEGRATRGGKANQDATGGAKHETGRNGRERTEAGALNKTRLVWFTVHECMRNRLDCKRRGKARDCG